MTHHIFNLDDLDNFSEKLNLDELYDKKREHDLRTLEVFNKILNRIHHKIKVTSRQKLDEQYCWFVVPEMMIGIPKYDQGACIAYILNKLQTNGFVCRYLHPNVLFISWKHWIPSYVRTELKKKTGKNIDGFGNFVKEESKQKPQSTTKSFLMDKSLTKKEDFRPINDYIPQNIVYNPKLLERLKTKTEDTIKLKM